MGNYMCPYFYYRKIMIIIKNITNLIIQRNAIRNLSFIVYPPFVL